MNDLIERLSAQKKEMLTLCMRILSDNKDLYTTDMWCMAVANVSCSNITAFTELSRKNMHLAAIVFIRMHLDCLLRLFSSFIITPMHDWTEMLSLSGESISKCKVIVNGKPKPVTQRFLCEQITAVEKVDWVSRVFDKTSRFIHPSDIHFRSALIDKKEKDNLADFSLQIRQDGTIEWPEDEIRMNYMCMIDVTDKIIKYLTCWYHIKNGTESELKKIGINLRLMPKFQIKK